MIPETEAVTAGGIVPPQEARGTMDAITRGTMDGIELLVNVIAMLVVFVALVYQVNGLLGLVPVLGAPLTMQRLLG